MFDAARWHVVYLTADRIYRAETDCATADSAQAHAARLNRLAGWADAAAQPHRILGRPTDITLVHS